jgi:transposase
MGVLLHPLILFKMIFIGYIYGIRSERQLEREIRVWKEFKEKVRLNRLSKSGKVLNKFRKEKIE